MSKNIQIESKLFGTIVNITVDPSLNSAPMSEGVKKKLELLNERLSKIEYLPDGTKLHRREEE